MAKEVIMPVLGMNQETGTLVEWFVEEGGEVTKGEPLMLVATDKTEVEIEAMSSGVLANITAQPGDEVPVGSAVALILAVGEVAPSQARTATAESPAGPTSPTSAAAPAQVSTQAMPSAKTATAGTLAASPVAARIAAEHNVDLSTVSAKGDRIQKGDVLAHIAAQSQPVASSINGRVLASPKARRLAQESGIEIATLSGTGPDGAILSEDVLTAASSMAQPSLAEVATSSPIHHPPSTIPVSRAWKVMAQRLTESWQTVPHFYLERSVDATALLKWRKRIQKRSKQKVTVTDLLTKVVAVALTEHPRVNASWIDDQILLNANVNVGLAVAVEDGLLVPVVHGADQLGIGAIAERRTEVVNNALDGRLAVTDMQDGTFTISNLGMFGITKFNAIVNPPQAAILAVGGIEERVVPVNGKPKVRSIVTLTLSCDHRVVDGARGARFMQTLVNYIAEPLRLLE